MPKPTELVWPYWHPKLRKAREDMFRRRAEREGKKFLAFMGINHTPVYANPEWLTPEERRALDIKFMKYLTGVRDD